MNVVSLLYRAALTWPDLAAVIDPQSGRSLSFSAFAAQVRGTASWISALAQHSKGARIALLSDASVAYLCADYGAMAAGYVRLPLDPALGEAELAAQLRDAGASVLLFGTRQTEMAQRLATLLKSEGLLLLSLEANLAREGAQEHKSTTNDETPANTVASLNYTGGSTGRPKAVVHTHGSLIAVHQNIGMARGVAPGDVFLNVRPLWPIAALIVFSHLVSGGTVVLGSSLSTATFWTLLSDYNVSHSSLVPTQLHRLLRDLPRSLPALDRLKAIDIGAAAIAPDLYEEANSVFRQKIAVLYGLTEAPWTCYRPATDGNLVARQDEASQGNVGRPNFSCELSVRGADGLCPLGHMGEVYIRGPHLMQGYWNQPDLTADVMQDGWFRTGDLGFIRDDGRLFIKGRAKDIIRTGGKSVQPQEVEEAVQQHPAVLEAAAVGMPDAEWGEIVALAVVLRQSAAVTEEDLAAHCRGLLSSYKRPKVLRILDHLPRSHYGKVQRAQLIEALHMQNPVGKPT